MKNLNEVICNLETVARYAYYEPIKNKIYATSMYQGDTPKTLMFAIDGKQFAGVWYFTDKWEGAARFYFLGRV